jgi:hypothetical protein
MPRSGFFDEEIGSDSRKFVRFSVLYFFLFLTFFLDDYFGAQISAFLPVRIWHPRDLAKAELLVEFSRPRQQTLNFPDNLCLLQEKRPYRVFPNLPEGKTSGGYIAKRESFPTDSPRSTATCGCQSLANLLVRKVAYSRLGFLSDYFPSPL